MMSFPSASCVTVLHGSSAAISVLIGPLLM